jgi:hypothetical protein
MIPNHNGKRVVNQTTHWFGMDSEETFLSHINDPQKKELLEKYGWIDPECILYRHNSHGFRCIKFDSRPAGLALGCSFTHGVGINEDQAWPAVLSNLLNIHIWNLGIGGAAYDTVFRLLDYYLLELKPKFVVIFEPPKSRFEIARNKNDFEVLNPNCTQYNNITYKNWFANDENSFFNHRKNQLACKYICQQNNIPIFQWDSEDSLYSLKCSTNLARDLTHPGPQEHERLANLMFEKIQNLL